MSQGVKEWIVLFFLPDVMMSSCVSTRHYCDYDKEAENDQHTKAGGCVAPCRTRPHRVSGVLLQPLSQLSERVRHEVAVPIELVMLHFFGRL